MITRIRRIALEPALVRLGVLTASVIAVTVATPVGLPPLALAGLVGVAVLPALFPRGRWTTLVVLAAAVGWIVEPGALSQLLLLAAALYLLHTLAELAGTLPYDARVDPEVLLRWLVRALGVLAAGSVLAVAVLVGVSLLPVAGSYVVATVAGLVLTLFLTRQLIMNLRP
jgi:hypothetical protein